LRIWAWESLPGLTLLSRQERGLFEQSADAVTADLCRRMQPTKEAHAAEAFGEDMLEKAAEQFGAR
jgi:hypothetical protein